MNEPATEAGRNHPTSRTYFVNGESFRTEEKHLSVREILSNAGFEPTVDYVLSRDSDQREFANEDHEVKIEDGERFTAKFRGPTPTS